MDERTTDALRAVVEDMAHALHLATKNGEALILFLEEMLSSLECWAADYNVTLNSKPAIALRSHSHHSSQIDQTRRSPTELASSQNQDMDAKQGFAYTQLEAEHQVASPISSGCAYGVPIDGKSSVGIFCFDAECERARMLASKKRHDNHVGIYGNGCDEGQAQMQVVEASKYVDTQKDMHLCEKRAKMSSTCPAMEHVKEERCEHDSMAFLGGAGAFHIDPHIVARPDITPTHVHSSLHMHCIGMQAYKPAPDRSIPLQDGEREPSSVGQKGEKTGSDWLQEGSSM